MNFSVLSSGLQLEQEKQNGTTTQPPRYDNMENTEKRFFLTML